MKNNKTQDANPQSRSQLYKILLGSLLGLSLVGCDTAPPTAVPPSPTPVAGVLPTDTPAAIPTATPLLLSPTAVPSPTVAVRVYDARVQGVSLHSAALGIDKAFYVYLPAEYEKEPDKHYPVLYLFRGHEREWVNPSEDSSRGGEDAIDVYERLRSSNGVGPLILVFPGLTSDDNTVQSVGTNMRAPQLAKAAGIGTGRFEDYLLQELIPYVDSHYRTVATREGRGLDGFSLGATVVTRLALAHPDRFRTVGAFDGLYFWPTSDCASIDSARDEAFNNALFDPAFGVPRDGAFAAANNAPNLLCQATPAQAQSLAWFIQYGPESAEPNNSNYYRGAALVKQLAGKGVTNGFSDPVLPGGHHWSTADEHLRQTLPLHWQVLGPAAK